MKYKLINRTKISSKLIKNIIEYCCPNGLDKFRVIINPVKYEGFDGESFYNYIKIGVNKKAKNIYNHQKNYKRIGYVKRRLLKNTEEILVYLLGHELRHMWQMRMSKQNFNSIKGISFTHWDGIKYDVDYKAEKDANLYGIKILDKYRYEKR